DDREDPARDPREHHDRRAVGTGGDHRGRAEYPRTYHYADNQRQHVPPAQQPARRGEGSTAVRTGSRIVHELPGTLTHGAAPLGTNGNGRTGFREGVEWVPSPSPLQGRGRSPAGAEGE